MLASRISATTFPSPPGRGARGEGDNGVIVRRNSCYAFYDFFKAFSASGPNAGGGTRRFDAAS